jgi:thiopurine S-methyltransferase
MDPEFWHERWKTSRTGFHLDAVNAWLVRYWPDLGLARRARILVPLCGKSLDMLWLHEQGYHVIGVEVSRIAIEAFFAENNIEPTITSKGRFTRWKHAGLELLCGDFLEMDKTDIGPVTGIYDRAALIALPAPMRPRYVAQLAELSPADTRSLLITLEYDQRQMDGPPFSVPDDEVIRLFGDRCSVEQLATADVLETEPKFRERGLGSLRERVYRLIFS